MNPYLYSALIAAVSICVAKADTSLPQNDREKCYGFAKAGENDCNGTGADGEYHSCPGWSEKDNDPHAWSYVLRGKCLPMGGSYSPPPVQKNPKLP